MRLIREVLAIAEGTFGMSVIWQSWKSAARASSYAFRRQWIAQFHRLKAVNKQILGKPAARKTVIEKVARGCSPVDGVGRW
jgi:hypothetical protein